MTEPLQNKKKLNAKKESGRMETTATTTHIGGNTHFVFCFFCFRSGGEDKHFRRRQDKGGRFSP